MSKLQEKALSLAFANPMVVGGVVLAGVAVLWLVTRGAKQTGKDIGSGAVNLVAGVAGGAANAVVDNALDPSVNPFYDVGTSLGGWIFDVTHPGGK